MNNVSENAQPAPVRSNFYPAFFLALFLGPLGVHRFYTGKIKSGILQLVTFGGCGVWAFVDLITILLGKFKDKNGIAMPNANPKLTWPIFVIVVVIGIAGGIANSGTSSGSASSGSGTSSGSASSGTAKSAGGLSSAEAEVVGAYLCQSPAATLRLDRDKSAGMMINGSAFEGHWRLTSDRDTSDLIEFTPNVGAPSSFTVYTSGALKETKYGYRFEKLPSR